MFKLKTKILLLQTYVMQRFFTPFFVSGAKYHIDNANEMILLKSNNLAMYGKEYSKSFVYARIELSENWHLLMFNVFNSFLGL